MYGSLSALNKRRLIVDFGNESVERANGKPFQPVVKVLRNWWTSVGCFLFVLQIHYLFGGNPGKDNTIKMRLDDFWSLEVLQMKSNNLYKMRFGGRLVVP